ncbi:MAG TPA: hypothetical protein VMM13_19285, partial [Euzebya sp.]|nr:hypothetical protein [Euzebya sp.]
ESLAGSFLAAGAAAVVATSSPITAGMAVDFATEVINALLANPRPVLGTVVRDWRREVLRSGNPFGLALNALGPADVTFASASA